MNIPTLSRLERVDLRQAWVSESGSFTPWLSQPDNLALLGDAIGIELECEAQEKEVGPFRADILCKDTASDAWVLIENQLERTDHTHLGQLMTYAAGLKAVTIVWVAQRFTDEHRAALDWLNEITDDSFNFFGLEVELWKIADSPPAPKFNVVCQPNDWVRYVRATATGSGTTEGTKAQLEFWNEFVAFMEPRSELRCAKPQPQGWLHVAIGRTGFVLAAVAVTRERGNPNNTGALRAELVLNGKRYSKVFYRMLFAEKDAIERELGEPLVWNCPENSIMCRIYLRYDADFYDRARWPEYHEWLRANLERMNTVFAERVRNLEIPDEEEAGEA